VILSRQRHCMGMCARSSAVAERPRDASCHWTFC